MTQPDEQFSPFVEARVIPSRVPFASGTIDTSGIDAWRQGIDVHTDAQRFVGVIPKLGTDQDDHTVSVVTFGQSSEFEHSALFQEVDPFDPVRFLEDDQALVFPVVLDNPGILDPEHLGGFIEPLAIPARSSLLSNAERDVTAVQGQLQSGNEDTFGRVDTIASTFDPTDPTSAVDAYVDSGLLPLGVRMLRPFDESRFLGKLDFREASVLSPDVRSVVVGLLGSDTDAYVPFGLVSVGTGFVYDGGSVDSLAFGGLKR